MDSGGQNRVATGADYISQLQQLYEVTGQLQAALQAQDWEALLEALSRRQELMDHIDAMPESARALRPEEVRQAVALLSQVNGMDEQATSRLSAALDEIRAALQAGGQARTTISAYQRANRSGLPQMDSRFIDRNR